MLIEEGWGRWEIVFISDMLCYKVILRGKVKTIVLHALRGNLRNTSERKWLGGLGLWKDSKM